MNKPAFLININPDSFAELKRIGSAANDIASKSDFFELMLEIERQRRWREDPMNLMPYWRSAGDLLNLRKVCWALGDFFNSLGNL